MVLENEIKDCWCAPLDCEQSNIPMINIYDTPPEPECIAISDLCDVPILQPDTILYINSSLDPIWRAPCDVFRSCYADVDVSVDNLLAKMYSCDPTVLSITKEWNRIKFCANFVDEKVATAAWCQPKYLKDNIEWVDSISVVQNWCKMQVSIKDNAMKKPFAKLKMAADHLQIYPWEADWAAALPNSWFFIPRNFNIPQRNCTDDELAIVPLTIWNVWWGSQYTTYWIQIKKDGWYRLSLKGSNDINNCVNAFRSMLAVSDSTTILVPSVKLDAKYWQPDNGALNEATINDTDWASNNLKQYQIWQSEIFFLYAGEVVHAYGRMDTFVKSGNPGYQWDGMVIWRRAWLSGWVLWGEQTMDNDAGFNFSVEWVSDVNGDLRFYQS